MAAQTTDQSVPPSPQVVANAFVEQYYHILHHSPELAYRFYQDSSVLSRQEENGEMTSVTTMQSIDAKILSLDYKSYKAEIKTADAQESFKDGVIALVTGCLTGKDNLRKKFAQSFFLAPQAKGYFVLNDVFRYVDESELLDTSAVTIEKEKVDNSGAAQAASFIDPSHALAPDVANLIETNEIHIEEQSQAFEMESEIAPEEEVAAIAQSESHISLMTEPSQMSAREDGVKNSYASILKKAKDKTGHTIAYKPTNTATSASTNSKKQPSTFMVSTSVAQPIVEQNKNAHEKVDAQPEVECFAVYVRNLPINVMDTQLEQEFKRFGQIKSDGVQVRSNKQHGTCYGFVEFLSASSMESAIQASPITIGGRQAFVEIKRANSRVDSGPGEYISRRGGFRNYNVRGRGGYSGGHGFNGNEFGGRVEYSGRGTGRGGRGNEGYQRGRGRSRGRVGRGMNQGGAIS